MVYWWSFTCDSEDAPLRTGDDRSEWYPQFHPRSPGKNLCLFSLLSLKSLKSYAWVIFFLNVEPTIYADFQDFSTVKHLISVVCSLVNVYITVENHHAING